MSEEDLVDLLNQDPGLTDYILDHLPKKYSQPNNYDKDQYICYVKNGRYIDIHKQTVFYLMARYEEHLND